jgi:hypothetical protein
MWISPLVMPATAASGLRASNALSNKAFISVSCWCRSIFRAIKSAWLIKVIGLIFAVFNPKRFRPGASPLSRRIRYRYCIISFV